jgi:hypothetical protein
MQINCVITKQSLKQTESTRWRNKTIYKYHTLLYLPENNERPNFGRILGVKEVFITSIAQNSLQRL